jgi:hypothetical protein
MLQLNEQTLLLNYHRNREPAVLAKAERSRDIAEITITPAQRPWITCEVCDLLWHLGHLLEITGQRLERRYAPFHVNHG